MDKHKIKIEEIHSKEMFPGLLIGKPDDENVRELHEKSISNIKKLLGDNYPITDISKVEWTQITETKSKDELGWGTWGHICGAKIQVAEGDDRYSFSAIFSYAPEKTHILDSITKVLDEIDWKNNSIKWDIGDW